MASRQSPGVESTVDSDEALARRLQAEEEAAATPSWPGPGVESATEPPGVADSGPAVLSDEDYAKLLQRQEEQPEASSQNAGRGAANEMGLTDEQLARMLQEQEERTPRAADVGQNRRLFQRFRPQMPHFSGGAAPSCAACMPLVGSFVSSGAFFGCCAGLQAAQMLGLGQMAMWMCTVGGTIAGHAASNDPRPFAANFQQHRVEEESDYDSDDDEEDDYRRGLDHDVIDGHTVGHVFNAAGAPTEAQGRDDENSKCMVCMEQFEQGDNLRSLPCLHRYHARCIDEWLARSPECPICKRDITALPTTPVGHDPSSRTGLTSRLFRGRPWRRRSS